MPSTEPLIALHDLSFRWRPHHPPVLEIERFTVGRGERLFLHGPSGSGKSTLLSLLGGVATPQRGRVEVLGEPLSALRGARRDRFRADHIGFVFQLFNLLPYLSTVDNVTLPCRFSQRRREKVLQRAATLESEARRLLEHLDLADPQTLARPVTELSVGQQQRVAVARALIGAPEIVIADEPTSALDWDRREAFLRLLEGECAERGITLLFVSHDPSLKPLFDRTVELTAINRAAGTSA
ncbi:ABC transporter ATP-binding protein [Endothiovibrio diazotrophicus]